MHSQRLRETALHPWIIAKTDGKIISAHCKAGLRETCTRVSAMMFYIDNKVRIRDSTNIFTKEAAYIFDATNFNER